VLVNNSRIRAA